jgi:hypothetical protein
VGLTTMRVLRGYITVIAIAALLVALAIHINHNPIPPPRVVMLPARDTPEPGPFHGYGNTTIGNVEVPRNTVLVWRCPACSSKVDAFGGGNFIVENGANDPASIPVDALGLAGGRVRLDAGVYHAVEVVTGAAGWSLRFTHAR